MEFGSLKYGLLGRSAPRYTSLRAPEGGVAIYNNNITLYYLNFFCI